MLLTLAYSWLIVFYSFEPLAPTAELGTYDNLKDCKDTALTVQQVYPFPGFQVWRCVRVPVEPLTSRTVLE
jgi:hypothetical protein